MIYYQRQNALKLFKNHIQLLILTTCPIFATYGIFALFLNDFDLKIWLLNEQTNTSSTFLQRKLFFFLKDGEI